MKRSLAFFACAVLRIIQLLRRETGGLALYWDGLSLPVRRAVMYGSVVALLCSAYFAVNLAVDGLETYWNRSAMITFDLPFPADVERPFNLLGKSGALDVRRVVLAGDFSGWDPDAPAYLMDNIAPGKWCISVRFLPGDHQYKFAVHARSVDPSDGEEQLYWVYDKNSSVRVSDSYGGYNSVYRVYNADTVRLYIRIVFAGFTVLLCLVLGFSPLFRMLLSSRISFRFKIVFSALVFGLATNIIFIALNFSQQREMARLMVAEPVNMIHLLLRSQDVDFSNLAAHTQTITDVIDPVIFKGMGRSVTGSDSQTGITLDSFAVFDSDFNLVSGAYREENAMSVRAKIEQEGGLESYFRGTVFLDSIISYRHSRGHDPVFSSASFSGRTWTSRRNAFFLGFTQLLQPIFVNSSLTGFYCAEVNVDLYGSRIMYNLMADLALLPLFLFFYYIIFSITGRWLTGHLDTLLACTERIKRGDFSLPGSIRSGDEIQTLFENFDAMRVRLKGQIDEINAKNRSLTEFAESLEAIVDMRTSELKDAMARLEESNQKLEQISITDALTGVFNRRHFNALADVAFRKAFRDKTPFTVIMADIDNFKMINDTWGHPAGDKVLAAFAKSILLQTRRPGDVVARYGGEEFILFLENTLKDGGGVVAEKIRNAAEELIVEGENIRFTASFGVFSAVPSESLSCEDFIKRADEGLYAAKKTGKNRVCTAHEDGQVSDD